MEIKVGKKKTRDFSKAYLSTRILLICHFFFELHRKMYTLLEHCDLLAYIIVSNLCRTAWF